MQYAKELLQIFVSEMSYFKSHMFSAIFVLKGGTVFDMKATRAQTIVLPGGKGDVFLLICSQGLYSVFLGQDFPVTLSTALKHVTVLSYNYSINLMIYWYITGLAFLA